jgi:hypothetical protein
MDDGAQGLVLTSGLRRQRSLRACADFHEA